MRNKQYISDPLLLAEWDYTKNETLPSEYTIHSNKKVWWVCSKCGHEWITAITNRTYGTGCPKCAEDKRANTKELQAVEKTGSLQDKAPGIAAEWNYAKNDPLLPSQFTIHSNKEVWWLCKLGHEWKASIASRQHGGCPYCSGRRVLVGFNDLETTNPLLSEDWDYEKNKGIKPTDFVAGSKNKVWWKCHICGYQWQASIGSRNSGKGCPSCAGKIVIPKTNDLLTLFPHIAAEWDYERNTLKPDQIMPGSHKTVWWKCKSGHHWRAIVANRTYLDRGCPYCNGRVPIVGENDLETLFPEISKEWDMSKNNGHMPNEFLPQSNKKIWWICNQGHSYQSVISDRTNNGAGCPFCANKKVLIGFNDIAFTNPEVAKEWDYEKNGKLLPQNVTAGSDKTVWWKCSQGHSWRAKIFSRCRQGTGCPICFSTLQRSFPEAAVYYYLSQKIEVLPNAKFDWLPNMEIDVYIPTQKIGVEYDGSAWHKDADKDLRKNTLCYEHGVRLIRIREPKLPDIEGESIKLPSYSRSDLKSGILMLLSTLDIVADIDLDRDEDAIRQLMNEQNVENSLGMRYSALLKEWDLEKNQNLSPYQISYSSARKVWWKCEKGHSWKSAVYSRISGSGCPYCSGQKHAKIICVENGKSYTSYSEVAKDLEISIASVSLVLNKKQDNVKGYHLRFADE